MGSVYWPDFCGNNSEHDAFWSYQLSINTSNPDLTVCFQRTALSWIPPGFLVLLTPFHLWSIYDRQRINSPLQFSKVSLARTLTCLVQILLSLLMVFWVGRPTNSGDVFVTPADYLATSLRLVSLVGVLILLRWDHMKGVITSGVLCLFWLFTLLVEIIQCRSNAMRKDTVGFAQGNSYFITYNIYFAFVIIQFLLTFFVDNIHHSKVSEKIHLLGDNKPPKDVEQIEEKHGPKPCPENHANFWRKITFNWLFGDIIKGYRKSFSFGELYTLRVQDRCKTLLKAFNKSYFITDKAKVSPSTGQRPHRKLWRAILDCVKRDFLIGITFRLISIPISFINPQLLSLLINFVGSDDPNDWKGIIIAASMLCVNFIFSLLINNFLHRAFVTGMQARSLVNTIVYRKALRLSSTARKQTTTGQVVNLMSVDAQKVQDMYVYSTLLWTIPIMIALSLYFLWQTIGPSCLAGLAVLLILVPLNAIYLANKAFKLQGTQMTQKDQRFKVMNEILSGMKVLKLYAWEPSFEDKILGYRNNEMKTIKYINYINAFGSMCWLLSPYLVSLAIFTTYVLIDPNNVLTADKAFVTLSLINMLNWPLSILPLGVANTTQGVVSVGRIAKFLDLDELEEEGPQVDPTLMKNKLVIDNATLCWGRDEAPTLTDIDLKVADKQLVAVVGAVGCGKSSLINAILGEMFAVKGKISYNGNLAYVPQQAWIVHNSLKENITFGKTLNQRKYEKVVKACALEQDLAMLPGGDETEIGEKGINLSGGQKQRVSLARAVYQDEDIYLLDDPLSAVDAHVGKHIFENVIGPTGVLRNKTRVLVTHGITYLPHCDVIVVLKDGRIEETGKYEELLDRNGAFADVIRLYLENEALDGSDEESEAMREVLSRLSSAEERSDGGSVSLASDYEGSLRSTSRQRSATGSRKSSGLRKRSHTSRTTSVNDDKDALATGVKLIEEEKEEKGNIGFAVVKTYFKSCGYVMLFLVLWSHLFYMAFQILTNIWLSAWTSDISVNITYDRQRSIERLSVYGYLGIGQLVMALIEAFAVAHGCYSASLVLHKKLLSRIMRAPMSFFDTTPLGRIMNRFSKDLDVLDANMPLFIRQWLFAVAPVIITIVLICYSTPIFAVIIIPLAIAYVILQRLYVASMRQWKRIDSVRRSPIYIHFDESVVGSTSIRAYRREEQFINTCDRLIDESQRPWFLVITGYRWCGVVMECLGACVVFFASLFAVLQRSTISAGMAGLSVSYALQVTVYMSAVIRTSSELESYVVSVERIDEYLNIDSEADWEIEEKRPPAAWPEVGAIQFSEYSTRYRKGLDLVLRNIDFFVKPGERIGIVGRTGAGKSSLSLALFRLIEAAAGNIYIDGRSIADMGLHALRSQVSIIPQDPVVFSGSLRSNLDPFSIYTDLEVWQALEHAHLKTFVADVEEGLEYECGENGEALSVGQRQLLCLARALLRKSKILVLDEATAAVDFETDSLIQTTIREKFKHCTILTVAHRLYTVMDYNRILVLSQGRVLELDSPDNLIADKSTVFYGMAKDAGLI